MPGVGLAAPDVTVLRKLEALSGDAEKFHKAFKDLLESDARLVTIGLLHKVIPEDQSEHFDKHWFPSDPKKGYWPDEQPIEPGIRSGLLQAFSKAILDDSGGIRTTPRELVCSLKQDAKAVDVKSQIVQGKVQMVVEVPSVNASWL
jgi:hypothetical protein